MPKINPVQVDVLAPNLKRRMSGVTSTVVRLVPLQAQTIAIAALGPRLPEGLPQVSLESLLMMPRRGPSGPRIWHARRNTEMLLGVILKYLLGKKLVLLFTSAAQRHHTAYTRWLLRRMDAVVATSQKSAVFLERPATVIPHGIDTETFCPAEDRTALRHELRLDPEAVIVGCFGRIRPQKGTDLFVEAMLRLLPDFPTLQGVIMGGVTKAHEGFVADLRRQIAQAQLSDRLLILPEHKGFSIAPWFQAIDLYIAPQRWEGFGLTPLEAMSCGVPVVATRAGAFEEMVIDGQTGRIVDTEDIDALTDAARAMLKAPEALRTFGVAARNHTVERFALTREADALNALYKELFARS